MLTTPPETGYSAAGPRPGFAQPSVESLLGLATPEPSTATFFGFRVGHFHFLVPVEHHCEVIEQTKANPLPNTQPWFSGLINLRGNLAPVIDLRLVLGEAPATHKRRLFTIGKGERTVALWIDGLPEVLGVEPGPIPPLPTLPERLRPFVSEAHVLRGQVWLKLNYEGFFSDLGRQIGV